MALAQIFENFVGPDAPVEFLAYDGSRAGAAGSPVRITVRSPAAVSYLAQAPGALGLARAYVSGHLDVDGDMYTALARLSNAQTMDVGLPERIQLFRDLGGPKVLIPRLAPPPQEVQISSRLLSGLRHSKSRDAARSRTTTTSRTGSTSGCSARPWPTPAPCYPTADSTLEEAQAHKFDLVARKLGLQPGMRLLDVGLRLGRHGHARRPRVRRAGARRHAVGAAGRRGRSRPSRRRACPDLAEVRHLDYRDVPETGFDAVSSIGLTEHIGKAQLPGYFEFLLRQAQAGRPAAQPLHHPPGQHRARRAPGRLHQPLRVPRRRARGPRLPDLASCTTPASRSGTRRTCASTTRRPWPPGATTWTRTGTRRSPRSARARPGCGGCTWPARGSGSTATTIQLHQVLGVKLDRDGVSGMPLRPDWEVAAVTEAATAPDSGNGHHAAAGRDSALT